MHRTKLLSSNLINFGVPLGLLGALILLMNSSFLNGNDVLSLAITVDLLLTVPLVYFLLIRKSDIPNTTVIPVMIIGLLIGYLFLPEKNQSYLDLFKNWALPVIELSVLTFVILKVRKVVKSYKIEKRETPDFYDTLKNICADILPRQVVIPFATEVAVIYYGFIHWKKRKLNDNEFTYHKDSGTVALMFSIIVIVGVESITVHTLLAKWSVIAAWIMTFLSIYSGLQLFGFVKSMMKRPILIENNKLYLRYGIMTETIIDISTIEKVEVSSKEIELNAETRKLSLLGELESHNVIIRLKKENTLIRLYGMKRKYKNLALYVDKKNEFVNQINAALQQSL